MSTLANWSYTQTITVWPSDGTNEYGAPSFGDPYTIVGTWEVGTKVRRDDSGDEFVPSSVYHFEAADGSDLIPVENSRIKTGDFSATVSPPADAERVRMVRGWDMAMFGANELPDWEISTG